MRFNSRNKQHRRGAFEMYRAPFFFSFSFFLFSHPLFFLASEALFGVRFYMIEWLYEMIYQIDFFFFPHCLKSMHHLFMGGQIRVFFLSLIPFWHK